MKEGNQESGLCQACRKSRAEVTEKADDPKDPYRLCRPCHRRLMKYSLRPLEWYNLASLHGQWEGLLDSEHYDRDGRALKPEMEMTGAETMPAPSFEEAASSPESFIGYIYSRNHSYEDEITQGWHIDDRYIEVLKGFPAEEVLAAFSAILEKTTNGGMTDLVFELCARTLGADGADFVRSMWGKYCRDSFSHTLAFAVARCLPYEEAFRLLADALSGMEPWQRTRYMACLLEFRTRWTLDWIEENVESPVTHDWGYLAAESKFNWQRAKDWLERGRPLSLVALRALSICFQRRARGGQLGFKRPPIDEVVSVLREYEKRDDAPAVKEMVSHVIALL